MDQQPSGREDYVRKVLEAYRNTPGTCGNLRRPDRILAVQLYQRGVPLHTVENALVLAAVRRLIRPPDAPPLAAVRSDPFAPILILPISGKPGMTFLIIGEWPGAYSIGRVPDWICNSRSGKCFS